MDKPGGISILPVAVDDNSMCRVCVNIQAHSKGIPNSVRFRFYTNSSIRGAAHTRCGDISQHPTIFELNTSHLLESYKTAVMIYKHKENIYLGGIRLMPGTE